MNVDQFMVNPGSDGAWLAYWHDGHAARDYAAFVELENAKRWCAERISRDDIVWELDSSGRRWYASVEKRP